MKEKKIQHKLEYFLLEFFIWFLSRLSTRFSYSICRFLGCFAYYFFPMRKMTAFYNLKRVLPDKSDIDIFKVVKSVYINSVYFFLESVIHTRLLKETPPKIVGLENLKKAYQKNKGVVLYTAHIGNWHMMGHQLVAEDLPLNNLVKRQRNSRVFDKEVEAMIESGMKVTILQKTPKNIFKALKNGNVVEFLADQDAGKEGVFVDFFGLPASTAIGPALFSLKMGTPLIFAVDIRQADLSHTIYIEEVGFIPTDDQEKDVYLLTEILTKKLEKYIIKHPDQYFWLHKRWLTRP
ncbi:MAG: lysophospholipid acyltransferase family protein [bacterium]|nr:lysophospholipid acyltransferase family protein [bacterium]